MTIKVTRDESKDITIHVVIGSVSEEEMYDVLDDFYTRGPTKHLLWDMSQAKVGEVASGALKDFVHRSAKLGVQRKGGRTAIIAPQDIQFGLGRMAEVFAEISSAPFKVRAFRARQQALEWLMSDCTS